ncbi:hypothetical protein A0H76_473 [Hepatospora eriocheir]|uniref:Uncharacterized protein n=1 Tax=Hepatospora eriocheir TaxID=1081669 RepID=A0A1X0Q981_9MICR|nr:hypothetical protein A0H76_473 [Hepatospora eriocheir]
MYWEMKKRKNSMILERENLQRIHLEEVEDFMEDLMSMIFLICSDREDLVQEDQDHLENLRFQIQKLTYQLV